jgi:hypothetical protein
VVVAVDLLTTVRLKVQVVVAQVDLEPEHPYLLQPELNTQLRLVLVELALAQVLVQVGVAVTHQFWEVHLLHFNLRVSYQQVVGEAQG